MEDFQEVVLCGVCQVSLLSANPRLLRCGHSMCPGCFDRFFAQSLADPSPPADPQRCPWRCGPIDFTFNNPNYSFADLYVYSSHQQQQLHHQQMQQQQQTSEMETKIYKLQEELNNTRGFNQKWRIDDSAAKAVEGEKAAFITVARADLEKEKEEFLAAARANLEKEKEEFMAAARADLEKEKEDYKYKANEWAWNRERELKREADNYIKRAKDRQLNGCHNCFDYYHWKNECPHLHRGKRCQYCSEFGHVSNDCRNPVKCFRCGHLGHMARECGHE